MTCRATSPLVVAAALMWGTGVAFAGPALDGLTPVAEIAVGFKNSALDADAKTAKALASAAAKTTQPVCYWIARGPKASDAKAVRAALGEAGIAPERVVVEEVAAPAASARAYCDVPPRIAIAFAPGNASLDARARDDLNLAALLIGNDPRGRAYPVEGTASAEESEDPIPLALQRAITARAWLVAQGVAAARLTFKSSEGDMPGVVITLPRNKNP